MNLICNSCASGHIYKEILKIKYPNPFIWSIVDFDSMYYLIKNYENINFLNYELKKTQDWKFYLMIENKIKIQCIHYKFDKTYSTPTIKGIDVFYNKIWEYIVEKYEERLSRMYKEQPIFMLTNWWDRTETDLTYDRLKLLNDLHKDNIICAVDKIYPEFQYIKQIERKMPGDKGNGELGKRVYDKFLK